MFKYIVKRIAYSILILLGVSLIIYFLIRLMPVDFIQDKRKLSQIMFSNFFKKDNSAKVLCFLNLFLTFLLFITINNVSKGVEQIINVLSTAVGG